MSLDSEAALGGRRGCSASRKSEGREAARRRGSEVQWARGRARRLCRAWQRISLAHATTKALRRPHQSHAARPVSYFRAIVCSGIVKGTASPAHCIHIPDVVYFWSRSYNIPPRPSGNNCATHVTTVATFFLGASPQTPVLKEPCSVSIGQCLGW